MHSVDELYRDQAVLRYRFFDRGFFCALTPYGVKELDSAYARRILAGKNLVELAREIRRDPHLHFKIKDNLLLNIRRRRFADK